MADSLHQFGMVERIALGTWMLVIGAYVATITGAETVTDAFLMFNILAFAIVMGGGPIIRDCWTWVKPRLPSMS